MPTVVNYNKQLPQGYISPATQSAIARNAAAANAAAALQTARNAAAANAAAALQPPPPAPPDKPEDPIGRFLEYDLGAGIKMKYALPALLLLAAALKGGGRR